MEALKNDYVSNSFLASNSLKISSNFADENGKCLNDILKDIILCSLENEIEIHA